MKDIVKLFKAKCGKIEKSRVVESAFYVILPPNKSVSSKKFEKMFNVALPDCILKFYKACDGFQLKWNAVIDGKNVTGRTIIMSYKYFISKKVSALENHDGISDFWPLDVEPERVQELKKYFIIDDIGYSNYVLCEITIGKSEPDLFLYLRDDRLYKLNCSFDEYILKTIEYGGIYLWQRYFCEKYAPSPLDVEDNCAEYLSVIFPKIYIAPFSGRSFSLPSVVVDIDYRSLFEKRTNAFKKKKGVKVEKYVSNPGVASGVVAKAQYTIKRKLDDGFLNFYAQFDGLVFNWSAEKHAGSINILPMENVFGGPIEKDGDENKEWYRPEDYLGKLWFDEEAENAPLLQKIRPIDVPIGISDYMGADFLSKTEPVLYYSVARDKEYRLPLTFKEYFHLLFEFMGSVHWQLLCVKGLTVRVGDFLLVDFIKTLLPAADFSVITNKITKP